MIARRVYAIFQLFAAAALPLGLAATLLSASAAIADPASTLTPVEPSVPGVSGDINMLDRSAIPSGTWTMADDVSVWKTITLGTYTSVNTLLEALSSDNCSAEPKVATALQLIPAAAAAPRPAQHCHLGDCAGEIISRPAFHLRRIKEDLDLVVVSLIELGFPADRQVALEDIQARADMRGYALCPAEAGPQLHL